VAETIQRSLLGVSVPAIDGIEVGIRAAPGRLAGGDYVDAIRLPGTPTVIGIGDVSGKSLPSALMSLGLKFAIRGLLRAHPNDLPSVLRHANDVMGETIGDDEYISALLCSIPAERDRLILANAGHDPPIVYRAATETIEETEPRGLVMGVLRGCRYEAQTIPLQPGDIVVLYTDGFTEARNPSGEQFTLAQLKSGLHEHRAREAQALADALFERIEDYTAGTFRDDASIVVMRLLP
jgi:sigma-B regulation protein RsbU (phosphoserine phosphatase)